MENVCHHVHTDYYLHSMLVKAYVSHSLHHMSNNKNWSLENRQHHPRILVDYSPMKSLSEDIKLMLKGL